MIQSQSLEYVFGSLYILDLLFRFVVKTLFCFLKVLIVICFNYYMHGELCNVMLYSPLQSYKTNHETNDEKMLNA